MTQDTSTIDLQPALSAVPLSAPAPEGSQPLTWRQVLPRFAQLVLPTLALLGLAAASVAWISGRGDRRIVEATEREQLSLEREILRGEFRAVAADLLYLARCEAVRQLLRGGQASDRRSLAEELVRFSETHRVYDQVRLLGDDGQELVRVNRQRRQAVIVPDEALQTKGQRYYFQETMALRPGEIFVSPLDLNVEDGRIERPLKPTIRFATQVVDDQGRARGILVLNYLGAALINQLRQAGQYAAGRLLLANSEGFWLHGPRAEWEWGFQLAGRQAFTMNATYPRAWRAIEQEPAGQVLTPEGLFTYLTIDPGDELDLEAIPREAAGPRGPAVRSRESWRLISYVSRERLSARLAGLRTALALFCLTLTPPIALGGWLLARARVRHELARQALHTAQRQIVQSARLAAIGEAMTGLAHESRNALQRSQAGLELLAKRLSGNDEALSLLGEIQQAQHHLHQLYERTRQYAAPIQVHLAETDLAELTRQAWQQLADRWPARRLRLELRGADQAVCRCDPLGMEQVLRNLLENAIDASPPEAAVEVEIRPDVQQGRPGWLLSVADQGPGIAPAEVQRVFEPFVSTKARGTGLGLALTRRLVAAQGGVIRYQNGDGRGARFLIFLPQTG